MTGNTVASAVYHLVSVERRMVARELCQGRRGSSVAVCGPGGERGGLRCCRVGGEDPWRTGMAPSRRLAPARRSSFDVGSSRPLPPLVFAMEPDGIDHRSSPSGQSCRLTREVLKDFMGRESLLIRVASHEAPGAAVAACPSGLAAAHHAGKANVRVECLALNKDRCVREIDEVTLSGLFTDRVGSAERCARRGVDRR